MRKIIQKFLVGILALSMVLANFVVPSRTLEVNAADSSYVWLDNGKYIEYPAADTSASASSSQSGYGTERLLDGDNNTRWEASWSNAPSIIDITLTAEEQEYITGIEYVSRLDNNIGGTMSDYEIYVSEDGSTYGDAPIVSGSVIRKLGTYFITFEEPVKAKSVKITSDVHAASEMRLLYIPNDAEDYDALMAEATALREEAGQASGMDTGLWLPDTLDAFDAGFEMVPDTKPDTEDALYEANRQLFELIRDLRRAQLTSTVELNGKLRSAENTLNAAVVGTEPLTWSQEAIDEFRTALTEVENTAGSQVAGTGAVADGLKRLERAVYVFGLAQNRPQISYTGTVLQPLEHMMDGLIESHFQGTGSGENVYIELDYRNLIQIETLTFQTWFATQQNIGSIKVQYKAEDGNWNWVEDGKTFSMSWTTNTNESESQTVQFAEPIKGSAIRIYIMSGSTNYVIDELAVGITVAEEDMKITLEQETVMLEEGSSMQLVSKVLPEYANNKNVLWSSSDESVVTVNEKGMITVVGIPEGQESVDVTITATTEYGNKTAQCVVTAVLKIAEETDLEPVKIRLKNAKKLLAAAKAEDYEAGAMKAFEDAIAGYEEAVTGSLSIGGLERLNAQIKAAQEAFEAASLIPIRETKNLIDRVTGENSSENFIIEKIPADEETGMDVYEVDFDTETNQVILRGNNGVALATAYNYYLKYFAYLDFPYVGESDLKLPEELPVVEQPVRIVFPYEYRHYFNENCEYKYTTELYGEEEWQHRIDWMAMNGFNMFLMDMGKGLIWYNAADELGLSEAALDELRHSNLASGNYYGEYAISQEAIEKEGALAKKIVEMAFALDMEPEIRPFSGGVPFMFPEQHDDYYGATSKAKMTISLSGSIFDGMYLYSGARWMNLPSGVYISPSVEEADSAKAEEMYEKYVQISDIYYESLMETLGFNEHGRTPLYAYKDLIGEQGFVVSHDAFPRTVLKEMSDQLLKLNPDAIWMQTSWRYQSWLTDYYQDGHLMFVDLSADNRPKWNTNNEFGGTQWLWSMLFNFGGNTGLGGGMDHIASEVIETKESASYMKGVAVAPEGGDTNPALYGLMAEMTWRSEEPDVDQWLKDYAKRRYGAENYAQAQEEIDAAWETLHHTVYSEFVSGDGPSQTLVNAMPKLSGAKARTYGSNDKVYNTQDILPVWANMLKAAEKMENPTPQFLYDLVDITRQVLADISGEVYSNIKPGFDRGNKEEAMRYANLMVEICSDLDKILATNEEFLLGTRLEGAKNRGVTDSDQAFYEELERTFLTYWVMDNPEKGTQGLLDYCNRHLAGLMTDYYGMRWEVFAKYLEEAIDAGMSEEQFNSVQQPKLKQEILDNTAKWAEERMVYATEAKGDSVEISNELWEKYQPLIKELYGDPEAADDANDLPLEGMTAVAGNEQATTGEQGPAGNVLDNDPDSLWHSAWDGDAVSRDKFWIEIQLPESKLVSGLRYLTRSTGGTNGIITEYRIEISNDHGKTYQPVCTGTWSSVVGWKMAAFDSTEATNVRLYAVSSLTEENREYASAAEIRLIAGEERPTESVVEKVTLNIASLELKVHETARLTATVEPEGAADQKIEWLVTDPTIVSVSEDGSVTALKVGTTTIIAKCGDVESAACTITVTEDDSETPGDHEVVQGVTRIAGAGRIDTGLAVAEEYKAKLGVDKFEAVVIATGGNFADALPGSYLAYVNHAPILLTSDARMDDVVAYVKANLKDGGKVYILGGEAAVSKSLEGKLAGYAVERLEGTNRYETNLEILKAAKVTGREIIVATGRNFADSLSASSVKKPILMVKDALTADQKAYLQTLKVDKIYIVGGTSAVGKAVEKELEVYGTIVRLAGENRRETSKLVAEEFFKDAKAAVVACAGNFPDGLCGGPLAAVLDAPLILTTDGKTDEAAGYVQGEEIQAGYVLGGSGALADETVVNVFRLESATEIITK